MVHQLLRVDQDLVRVKGRGNMTPLHHVAKGNVQLDREEKRNDKLDLLIEFLSICPDSITDVTTQNETALHIALKNNKIESFKALVGWLASRWSQNASDYERKILNWKDEEGNTVLNIAISQNLTEAVRHLFAWSNEVDIKNEVRKAALDMLKTQTGNSEMRNMQIRVESSKGSSITTDSSYAHYLSPPKCRRLEKIRTKYARQMTTISDDKRNALLVVATLLLSVTYQAALNPPGGLHEGISKPGANSSRISTRQAYVPCPANATYHRTCGKKNLFKGTTEGQGTANLVNTIPFSMFLVSNSVTFLISNSVTILLTPDECIGWMLSGTQAFLWACYIVSFAAITGYTWYWITPISIGTALYLILLMVFSAWTSRRHGLGLRLIRLQEKIELMKKKKVLLTGAVQKKKPSSEAAETPRH
ncbi:ankyrin repeat-containing protein bda1 [Quercus suber]|uniref:Ankyrin repeat-containing protein bda1 n=2 Tax=Quercus suber TaxID=58331 RepID=A0AAW0LBE8_QUESU